MGVGNRSATCSACGKRLNRKSWYYRNGKYYCKKRCWVTESEKAAQASATQEPAKASAAQEPSAEPAKPAPSKAPASQAQAAT